MQGIRLVYLVVLLPFSAHAIVNVEEMRRAQDKDGFSGRLDLSLSGDSGNTETFSGSIGTRLQWKQGPVTDLFILNYDYGESGNVTDANNGFAHLRHIVQVTVKRAYEAFTQIETDKFARLSFRGLIGGGVRYKVRQNDNNKIYIGLGAFHAWERLEEQEGLSEGGTDRFWRANVYLVYDYQFRDGVNAGSTTYYQPALESLSDARVLEEAALKVKLGDDLDLKIALEIIHDTRPPETVKKTDVSYSSGIEYHF